MTLVLGVALVVALVVALANASLSITRRAGLALVVAALLALLSPVLTLLATVALAAAFAIDATRSRTRPRVRRTMSRVLARGVPTPLRLEADREPGARLVVRQPRIPDVAVEPAEGPAPFETHVVARRRGRHALPPAAARVEGPLGLAAWYRDGRAEAEVLVYPDVPAARRLALAVRQGRFRDPGRLRRGPLGLGTDFDHIREYLPDDDVRQINWRATQRLGRPMSNQYRVEQDRDVVCVVDCGRLMAAPLGELTRLDAALDAVAAVALVADVVGDRCGVIAFDTEIRRRLSPRRDGGDAVIDATFDLEPRPVESDYEAAFHTVGAGKRAFVLVLTDLLDEAAASSLLDAVPFLARRHALVVASVADPDLTRLVREPPASTDDVFAAAVALDVLDARSRVVARLRRAGCDVVEAEPSQFAASCVGAYLRAKARARL